MKTSVTIILVQVVFVFGLFSQPSDIIKKKLISTGFENVRVNHENNEFYISFENNIYRWNVRALSTVLDTIAKYVPENALMNVIQLRFDIPQIVTKIDAEYWTQFRNDTLNKWSIDSALTITYKTKEKWNKVKKIKPIKPNTLKFDIVFYPQLYIYNFSLNIWYEVQFNIAPALEVSFWKGMMLTAQVILPIYNDCKIYGKEGNKVRPGFIVLSQDFRLNGPWFGNFSIGNFNYHRYGLDFSIWHPFKNPQWSIGLNAGLTGYSEITDAGWEFGDLNTVTFYIQSGYFWPRFNLRFDLKAGRFLKGDYGGRFDLTRMFGETAIGFYAAYTATEIGQEGHPNFGFHFAIPFPPGKRFKRKGVRVDLPAYFDWEYNGATELVYNRYYERRPNENRSEHHFNPLYIKNELLKNRHYK